MDLTAPPLGYTAPAPPSRTLWQVWRRFRRNRLAAIALAVIALFAPWLAPYDPYASDYAATWQKPNAAHWLGTDDLGRDVLARLIYGSRISISVGILSQLVIVLIGLPLGALAGILGGWFDFILMRVIEVLSSIPAILL